MVPRKGFGARAVQVLAAVACAQAGGQAGVLRALVEPHHLAALTHMAGSHPLCVLAARCCGVPGLQGSCNTQSQALGCWCPCFQPRQWVVKDRVCALPCLPHHGRWGQGPSAMCGHALELAISPKACKGST